MPNSRVNSTVFHGRMISNNFPVEGTKNFDSLIHKTRELSQSSSESKLNNFTRLEPVLKLLGVPFNTNMAIDTFKNFRRTLYPILILGTRSHDGAARRSDASYVSVVHLVESKRRSPTDVSVARGHEAHGENETRRR